jgi:cytochrome c biogenesis protein CcmG, thiol:disulfide interchange protein DsbE
MKRWLFALPLIALIAFGGLGLVQLFDGTKPSFELADRAVPTRVFQSLDGAGPINFAELPQDEPVVVNLWASWCAPCVVEHPLLMELATRHPGRVHGLVYEDTPANAAAFLQARGNPFTRLALDPTGQGGLEFGLTGVPETFVIAPGGLITHHHRGVLTEGDIEALTDILEAQPAP